MPQITDITPNRTSPRRVTPASSRTTSPGNGRRNGPGSDYHPVDGRRNANQGPLGRGVGDRDLAAAPDRGVPGSSRRAPLLEAPAGGTPLQGLRVTDGRRRRRGGSSPLA